MTFKTVKRIFRKNKPHATDPGASSSSPQNPQTNIPPNERRYLSPNDRDALSKVFPCSLDWMLANENIRIGNLIDTSLCIIQQTTEDEVDWKELERSSSEEAEDGTSRSGAPDPYGVPLTSCHICGKIDVYTRLTSCGVCYKRAHTSCLPWTARQDPR